MNRKTNNISIICPHFPPEIGASSHRIILMAQSLKKYNYNVDIVTSLPNYPTGRIFPKYRKRIFKKEVIKGMVVRRFWQYASNSNNIWARMLSMLSISAFVMFSLPHLILNNSSIIIINTPHITLGLVGVILAKLCATKSVLNVSDLWPLSLFELGKISKQSIVYRFLVRVEKTMYSLTGCFMGQSNEIVQYLQNIQPQKYCFLYRNLLAQCDNIHTQAHSSNIKIIYFGLLGVAQGIADICKNIDFAALGVSFHIYGQGSELTRINSMEYLQPRNISVYEPVPLNKLQNILKNYQAVLIPLQTSIFGAIPSKIYTSIASAVPILFMGHGEGRKLVDSYNIGWTCDSLDYGSLIKNITKLKNTAEYTRIKNNIEDVSNTEFNFTVQEEAFIHFLKKAEDGLLSI